MEKPISHRRTEFRSSSPISPSPALLVWGAWRECRAGSGAAATEKRTFSKAVEGRRCAIPASGYYEWRRDDRDRPLEKYAFLPAADGALLAMAGLYEDVTTLEGSNLFSAYFIPNQIDPYGTESGTDCPEPTWTWLYSSSFKLLE